MQIKHKVVVNGEELDIIASIISVCWDYDNKGFPTIAFVNYEGFEVFGEDGYEVVDGVLEEQIASALEADMDFLSKVYECSSESMDEWIKDDREFRRELRS